MRRRGFTLTEVLVWLTLLTTAALVADRLFRTMFLVSGEAHRSLNQASQYDQSLRRLRSDVSQSWRMLEVENARIELSVDEVEVTWRVEVDGSLSRQAFPVNTPPERWPAGSVAGFAPHPGGIMLHESDGRQTLLPSPGRVLEKERAP